MKRLPLLLLIVLLLLFACERGTKPEVYGEMPVRINLEPALAQGVNVTLVRVAITKGSFSQQMDLPIVGSMAEGTFSELEMGTYAIDVSVYNGSLLIATGSGTGIVKPGETTTVHITLHFVPGGLEVTVSWGLPYEESRRVLLVGNSHTYCNGGVDAHLQYLVNAAHPEWRVVVEAQTAGGFTLENHCNDPNTLTAIATGDWDLVILQEQSSRPQTDPALFYQYAAQLNTAINQAGALTGFYMTWAWRNNPEMYVPIRDAYYYIGAYLDALVLPAGVAFHNANQDTLSFSLYAPDNYHPSIYGTYLVACTMLAGIWNINPIGNSYRPPEISPAQALLLQTIAWETVQSERHKVAQRHPAPPLPQPIEALPSLIIPKDEVAA
ncbi:MAG TPA: hypothetical protein PL126_08285 [Candidatus Cloacimonadota bacterium]|nr:hypothetical protein [Candidatus Cloacimonadota bacterium]